MNEMNREEVRFATGSLIMTVILVMTPLHPTQPPNSHCVVCIVSSYGSPRVDMQEGRGS